MKESGAKASNQLDKLKGILKDKPMKKGLVASFSKHQNGSTNFSEIPALSVIKNEYENEKNHGFIAGDNSFQSENGEKQRITNDKNIIPVHFYDHEYFKRLRGQDFDIIKPPKQSFRHKKWFNTDKSELVDENLTNRRLISKMYIIPNKQDIDYVQNELSTLKRTNSTLLF